MCKLNNMLGNIGDGQLPKPVGWGNMTSLTSRQCCLIADDQQSGPSLQNDVEAAGFDVIGPFNSSSSALDWLEDHTPDLAVIDPALDEETGSSLVSALRSRGVPIVVYSD